MSKKIPKEMYNNVYEFYVKHLDKGVAITKVAELFNDYYGTNFAESSLRNRYEFQRDIDNLDNDLLEKQKELEQGLRKLALSESNLVSEQKKLQRRRSAIDSQLRYNADKELLAEIFKEVEAEGFEPKDNHLTEVKVSKNTTKIFNMSDLHIGYAEEGYYDVETAKQLMNKFFSYVSKRIEEESLKEVIISDTGDQIEGSALRSTQMATNGLVMSEQAITFSKLYIDNVEQLANKHPNVNIKLIFVDSDNHSEIRMHGARAGDTHEKMSKVISNYIASSIQMAQRFNGLMNVSFEYGSYVLSEVNGKLVMWLHGNNYNKQPENMARKIENVFKGLRPDVIIHGHFHNYRYASLNIYNGFSQTVISCPAMVGDTSFGREKLGLTSLRGFLEIDIEDSIANSRFIDGDKI